MQKLITYVYICAIGPSNNKTSILQCRQHLRHFCEHEMALVSYGRKQRITLFATYHHLRAAEAGRVLCWQEKFFFCSCLNHKTRECQQSNQMYTTY